MVKRSILYIYKYTHICTYINIHTHLYTYNLNHKGKLEREKRKPYWEGTGQEFYRTDQRP